MKRGEGKGVSGEGGHDKRKIKKGGRTKTRVKLSLDCRRRKKRTTTLVEFEFGKVGLGGRFVGGEGGARRSGKKTPFPLQRVTDDGVRGGSRNVTTRGEVGETLRDTFLVITEPVRLAFAKNATTKCVTKWGKTWELYLGRKKKRGKSAARKRCQEKKTRAGRLKRGFRSWGDCE